MKKLILALLQIRFCKKFSGLRLKKLLAFFAAPLFFGDVVYKDIHEEPKNKLTTKFAAKDRICGSAILISVLFSLASCQSSWFSKEQEKSGKSSAASSRINSGEDNSKNVFKELDE